MGVYKKVTNKHYIWIAWTYTRFGFGIWYDNRPMNYCLNRRNETVIRILFLEFIYSRLY